MVKIQQRDFRNEKFPVSNKYLVPIQYRGGFDVIPGDEIKTQMQSYAVQPCKLYFGELGTGRAGTAARGGERRRDRKKKGVKSEKPQQVRKRSAGG